jgi:hypothetical protein
MIEKGTSFMQMVNGTNNFVKQTYYSTPGHAPAKRDASTDVEQFRLKTALAKRRFLDKRIIVIKKMS